MVLKAKIFMSLYWNFQSVDVFWNNTTQVNGAFSFCRTNVKHIFELKMGNVLFTQFYLSKANKKCMVI